jgi:5-methylthioadenosine/S-adenosylhomocysteine deaminase
MLPVLDRLKGYRFIRISYMVERFAISAGTIIPLNAPPIMGGAILVSNGLVERIISRCEIPEDIEVQDYPDSILMPAFVNAHTHLVYASSRGIADNANFFSWLTGNIIPLDPDQRDQECLESARHGVRMCLQNGITAIGENHYLPWGRKAMFESKMKGVYFYELFGVRTLNLKKSISQHHEHIEKLVHESTERLRCGVAPHAPYSVPMSMAQMARDVSDKFNLPLSIHVAETHEEVLFFLLGEGPYSIVRRIVKLPAPDGVRTPLKYLDECGLLGQRTLLVHGVHMSDDDLNIIFSRKCSLIACPTSNAKLGSGVARASEWFRRGIPICIATDSLASGDSYDMFEEMRRFVLFQRALTNDIEPFTAEDVIRMVTTNPAKALGLEYLIGDLREGSSADLLLVKPDLACVSANRDIYQTILWGTWPSDIQAVWSDGREVYRR